MTAAACHPGDVLAPKLEAIGVTPIELARQFHVPANRITHIGNGNRTGTGETPERIQCKGGCRMPENLAAEVPVV